MENYQTIIIKCFSWVLFLLCSIGLFCLGYQCLEKYLSFPEGVEISMAPQTDFDFPSFTFCPVGQLNMSGDPPPFNNEVIEECGLKQGDYLKKNFSGKGGNKCEDPYQFWESVSLNLSNFGFESLIITYADGEIIKLDINDEEMLWTKITYDMGTCFMLTIPESLRLKEILVLKLDINIEKTLLMFIHQKNMLNRMLPWLTMEFTNSMLAPGKGYSHGVSYVHKSVNSFNEKPCNQNKSYSLSNCINKELEEVLLINRANFVNKY